MTVDTLVHPICSDKALRSYLPDPWVRYPVPRAEHYVYPPPFGEYRRGLVMGTEQEASREDGRVRPAPTPVISPDQVRQDILNAGAGGASTAILLPLTRGVQADPDLDAAIAAATNQWLVEHWLSDANADGRFKGSIRVSPRRPSQAVAEIRRWAAHPHMVQVAVPLQSVSPYGDAAYWPIWKAAAEAGLPVVVHADTGGGVETTATAVGYPLTAYAHHVLEPLNAVLHLGSLVAQGVFTHFDSLKWVFADGGCHAFAPIFWRFDGEWKESRFLTPWIDKPPTKFLESNVRLLLRSCDISDEGPRFADFLRLSHAESLLMFGSGYPFWDSWLPGEAAALLPGDVREAVMGANARDLYRLS